MEPHAFTPDSIDPTDPAEPLPGREEARPPALGDPLRLAALARRGSAAALRLLRARCLAGPVGARLAALRLLPGLIPFQPVWPILDRVDRPEAPAPVRRAVAEVRALLDDPRDCEPVFRAVVGALLQAFSEAERRRSPRAPRARLRLLGQVAAALYEYRFSLADGCIGDLRDRHVEEFLLEYAPRRLLVAPRERGQVPRALVRHILWLRHTGQLLAPRAQRLCVLSLRCGARYLEAARAPSQPGSPRAALVAARAAGLDLTDQAALGRFLTIQGLDLHEEFVPLFDP